MDTSRFFRKLAQLALARIVDHPPTRPYALDDDELRLAQRIAEGEEEPVLIAWRKPEPELMRQILSASQTPARRAGFLFRSTQPDGITCPHGSTNLFHCMTEEEQVVYVRERTVS